MKNILKLTVLLLILVGSLSSCEKLRRLDIGNISSANLRACEPSGTWKVKTLSIEGVLTNIDSLPNDADYPDISISIPFATQGYIDGNTFYNMIEFKFEIEKCKQIHIYGLYQYVENELIIRFESGIDAYVFSANSNLGIAPKELLAKSLNIWLLETDGTISLREIVSILSQHPDVVLVTRNGILSITPRDEKAKINSFIENMHNTVKYSVSNNELVFMDSLSNPIIIFNP